MAKPDTDNLRVQRVRLANLRQELLTPANALVGYSEILHEAAVERGLEDMLPDLERILSSSRLLFDSVQRLLDKKAVEELFEGQNLATVEKTLRHDLRTPINAIKGYGEMLLDDLDDFGGEPLRQDFDKLLGEANRLLSQLDTIIDFSRAEEDQEVEGGSGADSSGMFSNLAQSLGPIDDTRAGAVKPGHILVVDDIETNRDLLSRRLTGFGHKVTQAEGGRKALSLLRAEDFDLVLLDLMMPDINGFEVLAQLKADKRLQAVPVIMISALDEMDSVIRCIEAGAEDYMPKPFNPVLLKARINACLEKKRWRDQERVYLDRLEDEKEKFEKLLLNILPRQIVGRLNDGETIIADRFDNVSVLFADLVGFTQASARLAPGIVVQYLNSLFSEFDALARDLAVEKIKMIGDAYMVVAGVPESRTDHASALANMALGMVETIERVNADRDKEFDIRIGIHSGPVVAGIVGTHRFLYDVWGDTVNVASRLEASSIANRIQVSAATVELLGDRFELESRGNVPVKGRGKMRTYFLKSHAAQAAISERT